MLRTAQKSEVEVKQSFLRREYGPCTMSPHTTVGRISHEKLFRIFRFPTNVSISARYLHTVFSK